VQNRFTVVESSAYWEFVVMWIHLANIPATLLLDEAQTRENVAPAVSVTLGIYGDVYSLIDKTAL